MTLICLTKFSPRSYEINWFSTKTLNSVFFTGKMENPWLLTYPLQVLWLIRLQVSSFSCPCLQLLDWLHFCDYSMFFRVFENFWITLRNNLTSCPPMKIQMQPLLSIPGAPTTRSATPSPFRSPLTTAQTMLLILDDSSEQVAHVERKRIYLNASNLGIVSK